MENAGSIVRILIADDHQMFIDGLKGLLKPDKNIRIVAEANNGEDAFKKLEEEQIDLVITDINMPVVSGIELTRDIKEKFPEIKILVLTMYNDRGIINEILEAEADGYILKNTGKKELIKAIHKIANNGSYYCNEALSILEKPSKKKVETENTLTPREKEILKLVCLEYSTPEIAEKLYISPYTVDTHRKNILKKAHTKTIVGLIKFAMDHKIVEF